MKRNDPALIFFAGASGLLLAVSMPATYAVVSPFHSSGDWFGIGLALATLLAFEVGAIGCKLVTLAIPRWGLRMNLLTIALLAMTTVANYANGYDLFLASSLAPTLAAIRTRGYAPLVAIVYSATIPLLLFVFLSATVARVRQLQASPTSEASLADRRDRAILEALETLTARLQANPSQLALEAPSLALVSSGKPLALPDDSPSQLAPTETIAPMPLASSPYPCPHCGASLTNAGKLGAAKRYGYCEYCKPH